MIRQGASIWNEWKRRMDEQCPDFPADLSDADLQEADLGDADLSNANLARANLVGARVDGATLSFADLRGAILEHVNLSKTGLRGADFRDANLRSVVIRGLTNYDLSETRFDSADLTDADLSYSDFGEDEILEAQLQGQRVSRADEAKAMVTGKFTVPGYTHGPAFIDYMAPASFEKAILRNATLLRTGLRGVQFDGADLTDANMAGAEMFSSSLRGTTLNHTILHRANLYKAQLIQAHLNYTDLTCCMLSLADFSSAELLDVDLQEAILVGTSFENATIKNAHVYGISSWNLNLRGASQENLMINQKDQPMVRVDDLEVAQFLNLLLTRQNVKKIVDSMTKTVVLLLGRFGAGGLATLLSLGGKLRQIQYIPIVFDFDRPDDRDYTETVKTLAGLSKFVVVDLSGPSVPQELLATVPLLDIPYVPILERGRHPYSMFKDLRKYTWVLWPPVEFESSDELLRLASERIVAPAEERVAKRRAELKSMANEE